MPTAMRPPKIEVGLTQESISGPRADAGTRPDAIAPATQPKKNGVISDEAAKIAPNSRAWARVAAYLRKANDAPRKTIPSSARSSGMTSVLIIAANDSGKAVHQVTRQKISHTWFASHTGPMLWSMSVRSSAPEAASPAVRSKNPEPKSAPPNSE